MTKTQDAKKALVTGQLTVLPRPPETQEGGWRWAEVSRGVWTATESPRISLRGCECDLEMVCSVYTACLEGWRLCLAGEHC